MPFKDKALEREHKRNRYRTDPEFRRKVLDATKAWYAKNKERQDAYRAAWAKIDRKKKYSKYRAQEIRKKCRRYGVTADWYDLKFKEQQGLCAICGKPETGKHHTGSALPLAIDHNHNSMQPRGLLCWKCNTRLHAEEDECGWLEKALQYLKSYGNDSLPT